MAQTPEEKKQKEQERQERLAQQAEAKQYEEYMNGLKKQRDDEKVKAELNKYTFEKMDYFVKAHGVAPDYYRLLEEQEQKRREVRQKEAQEELELQAKLESLKEAADTGKVDEWIKANSENGEQSLEEVLKSTEESVS